MPNCEAVAMIELPDARNKPLRLLCRDVCFDGLLFANPSGLPDGAQEVPAAQAHMIMPEPIANSSHRSWAAERLSAVVQPGGSGCCGSTQRGAVYLPVPLEPHSELLTHKPFSRSPCPVKQPLVRAEERQIVHVPGIVLYSGETAEHPTERFEVKVGQPLADIISDGKPASAALENVPDEPKKPHQPQIQNRPATDPQLQEPPTHSATQRRAQRIPIF